MGVRQTSKEVYFNEVEPKLGEKQTQVLVALKTARRPINDRELADYLGWPINTITNRRGELVEQKLVELACVDVYPKTNRKVSYWRPTVKERIANECAE